VVASDGYLCATSSMFLQATGWSMTGSLQHIIDAACPGAASSDASAALDLEVVALEVDGSQLGYMVLTGTNPDITSGSVNPCILQAFASHIAGSLFGSQPSKFLEGPAPPAVMEVVLSSDGFTSFIVALDEIVRPYLTGVRTGIMLLDEANGVLQMTEGSFGVERRLSSSYLVQADDYQSNAVRVFTSGQAYISNHPTLDPGILPEYAELFALSSLITVPLVTVDGPIGVLHIAGSGREFAPGELQMVQRWAPHVANAIQMARVNFGLRRSSQIEEVFGELAIAIVQHDRFQSSLLSALGALCKVTETSVLAIVPMDAPVTVGRQGDTPEAITNRMLDLAATHPREANHVEGPSRAGEPGGSMLFLPLSLGSQRAGTLCILRLLAQPFSQEERQTFVRLAGLITLAWAAERYQQQRAELARLHERTRIANDLHDTVSQLLFASQMRLDELQQCSTSEQIAPIRATRALLSRADAAIREVIQQLHQVTVGEPLNRLTAVVSEVEQDFGVAIHFDAAEFQMPKRQLSPSVLELMAAAARECLINAAKHNPSTSRIMLSARVVKASRICLSIIDDGAGMSKRASQQGYGLTTIRRSVRLRGGRLTVSSVPSGGTHVRVSIPI
jgi:two-component system NarL family sensor kinase